MRQIITFTIILLGLACINAINTQAQQYFRISGEMTIKSKNAAGEQAITMGKVFYDRNVRQIIYRISFPEPETWVTTDSLTYRIIGDSIVSKNISVGMAEFSVFHLALNSHLPNFGLKNSNYVIESVEQDGENVVTTWSPPVKMLDRMGKILVSTNDKKLFGVIFLSVEGEVLRKQFFEEYITIAGMAFPGKIVEIGYQFGRENYQVSNFRNLKLDDLENNSNYHYLLPGHAGF